MKVIDKTRKSTAAAATKDAWLNDWSKQKPNSDFIEKVVQRPLLQLEQLPACIPFAGEGL